MKTKATLTYLLIVLFFLLMALVVWIWFQQKIHKAAAVRKQEYSQLIKPVVYITWKITNESNTSYCPE